MKNAEQVFPIYKIEHDTLLSMQGDLTLTYELTLPELFTLSNDEYLAFHQTWVKAIRLLPKNSIFHKQDWFVTSNYEARFGNTTFLSHASERFFNERPYLDHHCLVMLTKCPDNYRPITSAASSLFRKHLAPDHTKSTERFKEFIDSAGQFKRVLEDSGLVKIRRLRNDELSGTLVTPGILEQYCFLITKDDDPMLKDIHLKDEIKIGENHCQLFTLSDADCLPALCGPRITYDQYSTDKTKFSTGFASPIGALLDCDHIYNQYLFIEDPGKTIKNLEAKKLRLQSLSAYSRENAIGRDATQDFLNEAISEQRMPVKAHFNILAWTDITDRLKDVRNKVSSALAQLDAQPKMETDGAPQIWWAGLPGNSAAFPLNDTFDTFAEQACCFFNLETNYRSSVSPCGIRLGERLSGKPLHVDLSDEPMKKGITTNRNKFIRESWKKTPLHTLCSTIWPT
ncbi:MAG: TraG family conjugative transposon ATPase, partial [Mucilaginibacter sp.]|nr:TraG family conjugative transposon ATPase [Mucilaginibacter sp.]